MAQGGLLRSGLAKLLVQVGVNLHHSIRFGKKDRVPPCCWCPQSHPSPTCPTCLPSSHCLLGHDCTCLVPACAGQSDLSSQIYLWHLPHLAPVKSMLCPLMPPLMPTEQQSPLQTEIHDSDFNPCFICAHRASACAGSSLITAEKSLPAIFQVDLSKKYFPCFISASVLPGL